ncbi:MAG: hypothetical protein ACLT1K_07540 [[Clostridium] leptum]
MDIVHREGQKTWMDTCNSVPVVSGGSGELLIRSLLKSLLPILQISGYYELRLLPLLTAL